MLVSLDDGGREGLGLGVLTMMKLFSQLEQVDRATPFARREEGKISVVMMLLVHGLSKV